MSRRYRQSPVFYEPTPARWPWALALLLVIAAVVFAAVMRPGIVPLGGLSQLLPHGGPAPQMAPSPDPEIAANATAAVESVPTETSTAEADVSPAPLVEAQSADEVAAEWVARWNAGDYAGMYALASGTVRRTIPLEEFASRYQGIVDRAELALGAGRDHRRRRRHAAGPVSRHLRIGHRRGVQRGEHPAPGA